ncbi:protein CFAP20DC isoform X2 [Brachyhypopomus gauderio]|uniref:protein CFAP20DC isoform X2 n=1 Tax=Brachyhypopomus gauderio TaxID=698409 RepID=UPI00404364DA
MFKNEYQGGASVEIFSAQGKDPVAKWKLSGGQSSISRIFDKEVKGFVYSLEGSSQMHKMQLPKDGKMPLVLIQRFVVLQVNVPLGKDFSTELVVTDQEHLKRRLYLSTVHKEFSATPLHARIPLLGLRRDIWCNLCIDLGSLTSELFRGAVFLSLDGIVISACCKVRRIFTVRTEPADCVERDLCYMSNEPKEEIPKSCQFPPDVEHVTQLVQRLGQAHLRSAPLSSQSDQAGSGRAATARGPKTHDCSHIAFGSKVAGHPPLSARKGSSLATGIEHRVKTDLSVSILSGRSENLQRSPPTESASSERATSVRAWQSHSAWKERQVPRSHGAARLPNQESSQNASLHQVLPDCSNMIEEDASVEPHGLDEACCLGSPGPASRHLQCQSPSATLSHARTLGMGNNDTSTTHPQLGPGDAEGGDGEEVFTFSSCPHSAKRGQPSCDPFVDLSLDLKGNGDLGCEGDRKGARLEDDFVGSEGEEDDRYSLFLSPRAAACSAPAPTTLRPLPTPKLTASSRPGMEPAQTPTSTAAHASAESPWRSEAGCMAPTRSLSPHTARPRSRPGSRPGKLGAEKTRTDEATGTIRRTSVQEFPSADLEIHRVRESTRRSPAGSCRCDLHGTPEHEEDEDEEDEEEELQMLASLRREQEEEEGGAGQPGLSASQVHQCNVSLSMSSDDTSTWTQCIPLAAQQGQYYQKEMNPLQHSNPREPASQHHMVHMKTSDVNEGDRKEGRKKGTHAHMKTSYKKRF